MAVIAFLLRLHRRLMRRFKVLKAAFADIPTQEADIDEIAIALTKLFKDDRDWFLWECEQFRETGAAWFNHWRYHGTPWAYPDPSAEQRRQAFEASRAHAIEVHGAEMVARMEMFAAEHFSPDDPKEVEFKRQPDPFAWLMAELLARGMN